MKASRVRLGRLPGRTLRGQDLARMRRRTTPSSRKGSLRIRCSFSCEGKVKLAVTSHDGKEAIVDTLSAGEFFGEECLAAQPLRVKTATSVGGCALAQGGEGDDGADAPREARTRGTVRHAPAVAPPAIAGGPRRPAVQLQREAPGPDAPDAVPFRQGQHHRNRRGRDHSGAPGADGRHHPVAGQLLPEQVQDARPHRLRRRRRVHGASRPCSAWFVATEASSRPTASRHADTSDWPAAPSPPRPAASPS